MDKTSVDSPKNVERAIVSTKGTASPIQMIVDKDSSNPLMADTLPKSFNTVAETKKTKEVIHEKIIRETPEPDLADSKTEDTGSRSDENDLSIDQFTQHYDPNDDNDSGMSLDSVALHNLDT
ncbi:hypothetical protein H5410_040607 [Solanum commersonii]|uniref:Uncharacterized protein n=1 Tax=Solanum commersonii TaxID=4109 RepID=A0A9J5XQL1_SOLCO|nr:hypothetical protein H5410_040607 [Solanum commersonii]